MKIKNLSTQDLKLPMKRKDGQKSIVTLTPGQIVYSESDTKRENKQLIIWERKQLIEITDEPLPKNGEYCHPYSTIKLSHGAPALTLDEVLADNEDDDVETEEPTVDVTVVEDDSDAEPVIIDEVDASTSISKGKGGRPKGAKNKSKRGRKPTKRPYNKKSAGGDKQ